MTKTVTVLGGTGYIGRQLCARLTTAGHKLKVLTRHASRHKELLVLPGLELIEADTHDIDVLESHFIGCDSVINLIGILNAEGNTTHTFENAHVELTRKAVTACKQANVKQYIHMSALNADANGGSSEYLRSKGKAEDLAFELADNSVQVTAIRPSVVFGCEDKFFNLFAGFLKLLPVFPLACGSSKMAPVYVGDVCKCFVDVLENPKSQNNRINLVGPEDFTLKQLVEYTAEQCGLQRRIIDLPDWAARLQAKILGFVPGKPFSMDNYNSLKTDSICEEDAPRQPTSIQAIVPGYLGERNRNHQYQSYRQRARRNP